MYSRRSSGFVGSSFLPISCCPLSYLSIACALLVLNIISWCFVLYVFGHFINHIVLLSQFTSRLYLTNQLCPRNMSILFKSIIAVSICFLCLLISTLSGANLIISLFLVLFVLKTSNDIFASLVLVYFSLTNYLLISICVYPESTSA